MAAVTASQQRATSALPSRSTSGSGGSTLRHDTGSMSPQDASQYDNMAPAALQPGSTNASAARKAKSKQSTDPSETSKLLAAKISQLESDKAGEKDQEAEIEREVKKANRDLSQLLSNIESPMSRMEAVQRRYSELFADMKKLEREHTKTKKRSEHVQKEKDMGRTELSKAVSMRERLEKLCRELQKENKRMKEEHKKLDEVERLNREELSIQFGDLILDVRELMNRKEDPVSTKATMETDELFRQKFKSFIDQYELRELHFHSMMRTKEYEVQYNMAKYENQRKIADQEASRSRGLNAQVSTFSQTESELRSQLNIYVEKFKQVEDTLNNSNDLFLTFRKEMEEMSKKTKRLEKENVNLSRKHDLTNRNIIGMAEERTKLTKELETLKVKNSNLERLCRGMQAQGRGGPPPPELNTDSDLEYEEEIVGSEGASEDEGEYDESTEEEVFRSGAVSQTYPSTTTQSVTPAATVGQAQSNGLFSGRANGTNH